METLEVVVTSSVIATVISSIVGPLILQSRDRRSTRGAALEKIAEVESLRWSGEEYNDFRRAVARLEAAAIVAKIDREAVSHYVYLARVGRRQSDKEAEHNSSPPGYEGSIPSKLGEPIRDAAAELTNLLWHPIRSKWRKSKRLRSLKASIEKLKESMEEHRPEINWGDR